MTTNKNIFWCAILTILPEMFKALTSYGIVGQACKKNKVNFSIIDIRKYAEPPQYKVDDRPYGGGPGMVLLAEPLSKALKEAKNQANILGINPKVICMNANAPTFNHNMCLKLSQNKGLIFICGRYQGIDERFIQKYVDQNISIGNFIVSGGELPSMLIIDAILRQKDNILGNQESLLEESNDGYDYPHFTRPRIFENLKVPQVLLEGNHFEINQWKKNNKIKRN